MINFLKERAIMSGLIVLYGAGFLLDEFGFVLEEATDWLESLSLPE